MYRVRLRLGGVEYAGHPQAARHKWVCGSKASLMSPRSPDSTLRDFFLHTTLHLMLENDCQRSIYAAEMIGRCCPPFLEATCFGKILFQLIPSVLDFESRHLTTSPAPILFADYELIDSQ